MNFNKMRKAVYISGCTILAVAILLTVYFVLVGTGVIHGREQILVVKAETAEKFYDGTPLIGDSWEILEGKVRDGHTLNVYTLGEQTEPGQCINELRVTITDSLGADVSDEYHIEYLTGTLTVYARQLQIRSHNQSKIFDGEPLVADPDGWEIIAGDVLEGHTLEVALNATITDIGSCENTIDPTITDEDGNDVTQYYKISLITGHLTVYPYTLKIQSGTETKFYDGLPLTLHEYEILDGELQEGHRMEVSFDGEITEVGYIDNSFDVTIYDRSGQDVTGEYYLEYLMGTLSVLPARFWVESGSAWKVYDGTPLTYDKYLIISGGPVGDDQYKVTVTGSQTEVGSSNNTFEVTITDTAGNDTSHNYDIQYHEGTLTVFEEMPNPDEIPDDMEQITVPDGGGSSGGSSGGGGGGGGPGNGDGNLINKYLWVKSQEPGKFYFSISAYGDYTDGELQIAPEYFDDSLTTHPLALSALAAQGSGAGTFCIDISSNFPTQVLSYFILDGYMHPSADANIPAIEQAYALTYVPYDYEKLGRLQVPGDYAAFEADYRGRVYENYLNISDDIRSLLDVLSAYVTVSGDRNDNDILQIAEFVRSYDGNTYKDQFGSEQADRLSKFITGQSLGSITEYATFATMLYRYYGIPARVVEGVVVDIVTPNEWYSDISPEDFHVWVEVYIDGMGWVNLEVAGTLPPAMQPESPEKDMDNTGKEEDEDLLFFKVKSELDGKIYLRGQSYGDYTGRGWGPGLAHVEGFNTTNPLYMPGAVLMENGHTPATIEVEWVLPSLGIYAPYYTVDGLGDCILDTYINVYDETYTLQYIPTDMMDYIDGHASVLGLSDQLFLRENALREHAYQYYLQVPDDVRTTLTEIANAQGFSAENSRVIQDVAEYIQSAATYNLEFAPFPEDQDMVIYFLTVGKEGICQHYAAAATMMYRTLGIPARYVEGFTCTTIADTWVDVKSPGHAWVEVYIDGLGWIPVEVTAGGGEEEGDDGNGVGPGDGSETEDQGDLVVHPPKDDMKMYDGYPLTPTDVVIENGSLQNGHFIDKTYVTFNGSITEPGTCTSSIDQFRIVDALGNDVTDQYTVTFEEGLMEVFARTVTVKTESESKKYDGKPLKNSNYTYSNTIVPDTPIDQVLAPGHYLDFKMNASITEYGSIPNSIEGDEAGIKVYDESGNDVTVGYTFKINEGILKVYYSELIFETPTVTAEYNGQPIQAATSIHKDGELMPGHKIVYGQFASRTTVGRTVNSFKYRIEDADGNDVTEAYIVSFTGYLIVTARNLTIESKSDTKVYDGTPLVCNEYILKDKDGNVYALPDNLRMEVFFHEEKSSQTAVGYSDNVIESVKIYDTDGNDVSVNFITKYVFGRLQVTRP